MLGRPVVETMLEQLASKQMHAGLAIVQVGDVPESTSYVKQVHTTAKRLSNLHINHHHLPVTTTRRELEEMMRSLNEDTSVSGYMLQLPLPPPLQEGLDEIRTWIAAEKDIDLLGHAQRGVFLSGKREGQLLPPTPYAVMKLLKHYKQDVRGKIVVVVGDGQVGSLLKVMLGNDKATQIVCNEHTPHLADFTKQGDIVVAATGIPDLVTGDMIKQDAVVVNVGMKFVEGTMRGDVQIESVQERAAHITPITAGLGPVTVMALINNAFRAASSQLP